jgi:methionyl-tRNA formyltransferase
VKVAFAGTPSAAVASLRALLESQRHEVVAVITRPAAPSGRGRKTTPSPVETMAVGAGLPVLTPRRPGDPEFLDTLRELSVECCPVVAYGALLPAEALAVPEHGWVNLHFSLLPAWRGAAPVQRAILHGDEITGASTFRIDTGLDTGPVYGVVTESIRPSDTAGDLLDRLAVSGAELLTTTMDGIEDGSLVPRPQASDGASLAAKLTGADAQVDWRQPARHIDRLIRACTPAPGPWTVFRGDRLKLGPVRLRGGNALEPGELRVDPSGVAVGTATGEVELGMVQPPGRKPMPSAEWARGARLHARERLG